MTTTDALTTLTGLTRFLGDVVLPDVPGHHRGEVRAALKLLSDVTAELDALPVVLPRETCELVEVCARAEELLDANFAAPQPLSLPASLSELIATHDRACRAAAAAIPALQADASAEARSLLAALYEALGRHAERRRPWQAVFPTATTRGAS